MCENGICAVFTICLQFAIKKTVVEVVKKHCQVHVRLIINIRLSDV